LTPETRLNYGKLLMAAGREADALRILSKAREELEALDLKRAQQSRNLRKMGTILILLGEKEKADLAFDQALERDLRRLRGAAGPDEKARTLWSVARTLDARGDREGALKKAEEAQIAAGSADLRWWIGRWAKGVAGGAENP
jgi:tetratricopeptide (TPR) repeat protein